jgi:predicted RNA-binding protein with PUA-like domain
MVEISFVEQFPDTLPLSTLKATKALRNMMVTKKGSRLSIQPVTKAEFNIVVHLGRAANQRS